MSRPRAPFLTWPHHLYDERFGFAWYTAPATFVNQVERTHGTIEVANGIHDAIDHVLEQHAEDIERHGGLLMIHDWRTLTGYDSQARQLYLERMKGRDRRYLRHVVAVLPDRPLIKMAVETANIVMALSSGGRLRMESDPSAALARHEVRHPTLSDWR